MTTGGAVNVDGEGVEGEVDGGGGEKGTNLECDRDVVRASLVT